MPDRMLEPNGHGKWLRLASMMAVVASVGLGTASCAAGGLPGVQELATIGTVAEITTRKEVSAVAVKSEGQSADFAELKRLAIAHAPLKQIDPRTGKGNANIGRTPGSACEVIRFLVQAIKAGDTEPATRAKLKSLADWVISKQSLEQGRPWYGGVPSTPDLAGPAGGYFYTIDSAFCGDAMLRLHALTSEQRYLGAAIRFADFISGMHSGPARLKRPPENGFCDFVVKTRQPTWNCDNHVKNLIALPTLKRVGELTGKGTYKQVAQNAREFLVPGLLGAWEWADSASSSSCKDGGCSTVWRRIDGPQKQKDYFVYGDTLAYGMRGLFEYEGASDDLSTAYARFSTYSGTDARIEKYNGRIAFAGYLRPSEAAPDSFSAYYDIVTLGLLHEVRRAVAPRDFAEASQLLTSRGLAAAAKSWKANFDWSVSVGDNIDLTTVAAVAEASLLTAAAP